MSRASIVIVGTEITKGAVQDTNSHWLARRLTELGFEVRRVIIVPDVAEDIGWAVTSSLDVSDVVLVTGGLGFTEDDVTVSAVSRALGLELVYSRQAEEMIRLRVEGEPTYQLKAAYIPKGSRPLINPIGVSPGVHIRIGDKHVFLLPGVPAEMMAVFEGGVVPVLMLVGPGTFAKWINVVTDHDKESLVDQMIKPLREKYREAYFKTHASTPVRVSILVSSKKSSELEKLVSEIVDDVKKVLKVKLIEIHDASRGDKERNG